MAVPVAIDTATRASLAIETAARAAVAFDAATNASKSTTVAGILIAWLSDDSTQDSATVTLIIPTKIVEVDTAAATAVPLAMPLILMMSLDGILGASSAATESVSSETVVAANEFAIGCNQKILPREKYTPINLLGIGRHSPLLAELW